MSMPYTDDDIEEEAEVESTEDFEIEGENIILNLSKRDIKVSDGDADTLTGLDALKQWIEKAFATRAYVYPIYNVETSTDDDEEEEEEAEDVYGSTVRDILLDEEMDWEEKTAEIQLDIENVLSRHPDVIEAYDFDFSQEGRTLVVDFVVSSIYGEDFSEEVIINGANS